MCGINFFVDVAYNLVILHSHNVSRLNFHEKLLIFASWFCLMASSKSFCSRSTGMECNERFSPITSSNIPIGWNELVFQSWLFRYSQNVSPIKTIQKKIAILRDSNSPKTLKKKFQFSAIFFFSDNIKYLLFQILRPIWNIFRRFCGESVVKNHFAKWLRRQLTW